MLFCWCVLHNVVGPPHCRPGVMAAVLHGGITVLPGTSRCRLRRGAAPKCGVKRGGGAHSVLVLRGGAAVRTARRCWGCMHSITEHGGEDPRVTGGAGGGGGAGVQKDKKAQAGLSGNSLVGWLVTGGGGGALVEVEVKCPDDLQAQANQMVMGSTQWKVRAPSLTLGFGAWGGCPVKS